MIGKSKGEGDRTDNPQLMVIGLNNFQLHDGVLQIFYFDLFLG